MAPYISIVKNPNEATIRMKALSPPLTKAISHIIIERKELSIYP